MKFCSKCGNEVMDEAIVCPKCGCGIEKPVEAGARTSGLTATARAFMVVGTVVMSLCFYLIPLAWCLPMTLVYFKKTKRGEKVSTGFKVCSLLFVNTIAGILMLCEKEQY